MASLIQISNHTTFLWIPLIVFLTSLLLIKTKKLIHNNNKKLVPPSPPRLPLLGHLHLLGFLPHRSLWELSKKHGPVMLLKLGSVPTVVVSSAAAAKELFKLHDLASCSRPSLAAIKRFTYNFQDLNLSPYGDRWRELRKICMSELFSTKRVQSFQRIREEEVSELMKSISQHYCPRGSGNSSSSSGIDMSSTLYRVTANVTFGVAFGKSFRGGELDNEDFKMIIRRSMVALGSFSGTDYFPGVAGWIIDRISGVHGRLEKSFCELDAFFQHVLDDRIKFMAEGGCRDEQNIVDVLLTLGTKTSPFDALHFTHDCVKAIIMDIFLAGIETGENTLVWAMTELVRNPKVMKKLQDEMRSTINVHQVKESELEKLLYLKMVLKEVLRLHPPVPLLLPRETLSHFKLNGYDIEPKAHLYVNAWAIGRDSESWENPEEFFPERFIENDIDYKGQNFELIPFGAGRRICPGMYMGMVTVELALANMMLCFDWKLPNQMKEENVDVEEDFGLAVSKKLPLKLIPIPYHSFNG